MRTPGRPLQFAGTLRQIVARVAPDAALSGVETLEEHVETGLEPMRVAAQATAAVSLLGIALALAGIFASAAYRVTQQKKEIAIRIAIGAEPARSGPELRRARALDRRGGRRAWDCPPRCGA